MYTMNIQNTFRTPVNCRTAQDEKSFQLSSLLFIFLRNILVDIFKLLKYPLLVFCNYEVFSYCYCLSQVILVLQPQRYN